MTVKVLPTRTLTCRFAPDDGSAAPPGLKFQRSCDDFDHDGIADARGEGTVPESPPRSKGSSSRSMTRIWQVPAASEGLRASSSRRRTTSQITVPLTRRDPSAPKAEATFAARAAASRRSRPGPRVEVLGVDGAAAADVGDPVAECVDCLARDQCDPRRTSSGRVSFSEVTFGRALISVDPASVAGRHRRRR